MSKQQEITKNDKAAFKKKQIKHLDENIIRKKKCLQQLEYRLEKITQNAEKRRQKKKVKRDSVRSSTIYLIWVVEE